MSRIFPIILIVFPLLTFIIGKEAFGPAPSSGRGQFFYVLIEMPWYFKLLSILIGVIWLVNSKKS